MNARLFPPLFFLSFSSQSAYCNRIRAEKQEAAYGSPAGTGHAGSRKRKILRGFRAGVVGGGVLDAPQRKVTVFAAAFLLFDRVLRDCHVASLLAMTHWGNAALGMVRCAELASRLPLRGQAGHAAPLLLLCNIQAAPGKRPGGAAVVLTF